MKKQPSSSDTKPDYYYDSHGNMISNHILPNGQPVTAIVTKEALDDFIDQLGKTRTATTLEYP